jgi:hypothetical protein
MEEEEEEEGVVVEEEDEEKEVKYLCRRKECLTGAINYRLHPQLRR